MFPNVKRIRCSHLSCIPSIPDTIENLTIGMWSYNCQYLSNDCYDSKNLKILTFPALSFGRSISGRPNMKDNNIVWIKDWFKRLVNLEEIIICRFTNEMDFLNQLISIKRWKKITILVKRDTSSDEVIKYLETLPHDRFSPISIKDGRYQTIKYGPVYQTMFDKYQRNQRFIVNLATMILSYRTGNRLCNSIMPLLPTIRQLVGV
jgi:hypothetical protein